MGPVWRIVFFGSPWPGEKSRTGVRILHHAGRWRMGMAQPGRRGNGVLLRPTAATTSRDTSQGPRAASQAKKPAQGSRVCWGQVSPPLAPPPPPEVNVAWARQGLGGFTRRRSTTPSHADAVCATLNRGGWGGALPCLDPVSLGLDSTPCPWETLRPPLNLVSYFFLLAMDPAQGHLSRPLRPRAMVAVLTAIPIIYLLLPPPLVV